MLELREVCKSYGDFSVLENINLSIQKGEFISLLGFSGCGKSTLLRIIAGLEEVSSGKILYKKEDITKLKASKRKFAMVFQSYALFPHMNAYENLSFVLKEQGYSKKKIKQIVQQSFELVGLLGNEKKFPAELSGGQQQRVAIARALSLKPKILLLDEPLSALDKKVRHKLRNDIKVMHKELGITTIMVTHDQEEAISMSDRIALINEGKIVQIDTPKEIYSNPKDMFAANFIGDINTFYNNDSIALLRPEHISLHKESGDYSATIKDIEFLGSFFRVRLECRSGDFASSLSPNLFVCNLSLREFSEMPLKIGESVYFCIKQEHILYFKKD